MASSIMSRKSSLQAQTQSKSEVLQWVSFVLSLKVTKLEQVWQQTSAISSLSSLAGKAIKRWLWCAAPERGPVLPNSGRIRGQSTVAEGTEEPNHVLLFAVIKLAAMQ